MAAGSTCSGGRTRGVRLALRTGAHAPLERDGAHRGSGARWNVGPAIPMRRTRRRLHRTTRLLWFSLVVSIAFGLSLGSLVGADQTAGGKAWKAKDYQRAFQEFLPLAGD